MEKSKFMTFIFALIPGAGEMYMGLMKKGAVIMAGFLILFGIAGFLNIPSVSIIMPVIWFYSFFDTINLRRCSYEERIKDEEKFISYIQNFSGSDWKHIFEKSHKLIGICLVIGGIYAVYNTIIRNSYAVYDLYEKIPILRDIMGSLPTIFIAIVIILLGMKLIKGNDFSNNEEDDEFVEYEGKDKDNE